MTGPRNVAIVGFAYEVTPPGDGRNDAELLAPVVDRAIAASGLDQAQIGIVASAGSEFLNGVIGGVMGAFDALPCWPPKTHSHLEGDGAFALYEARCRLMAGESAAALVAAFSRPSADDPRSVLRLQTDPYLLQPLHATPDRLAAIQARALIESGRASETEMARIASRDRPGSSVAEAMRQKYVASPLRRMDCSTVCSGAAAVVLATGDLAHPADGRPAWITEMDQRIEGHSIGARDLTTSETVRAMARRFGLIGADIDVLEVHASYSHHELILLESLALSSIGSLNPSGGVLPADPIMTTGLIRIGAAAESILHSRANRALAHATNGPCLQHNLLCLMGADP